MFPGLFCQEGQGSGIVVGEVLDIGVVEQKLGKGRGALPDFMLPAASRTRVARALSSRHAITSSVGGRAV